MAVPLPIKCLIGLAIALSSGCTFTQDLSGIFCESNCNGQTKSDGGDPQTLDAGDELKGRLYVVAANIETDSLANRIRLEIGLVNQTDSDIELSQLTVRYYFTLDVGTTPSFQCNFVPSTSPPWDCDYLSVSFPRLTASRPNADHAIEIGFSPKAGVLRAFGGDTGMMKLSASSGGGDFNQTNDYSFQADGTVPRATDRITIHQGGQLVWGRL